MSVINRVLQDLDKRGVAMSYGKETLTGAEPPARRGRSAWLLAGASLVMVGGGAWWVAARPAAHEPVRVVVEKAAPVSAPVVATPLVGKDVNIPEIVPARAASSEAAPLSVAPVRSAFVASEADQDAVKQTLNAWVGAWRARDAAKFFSFYAAGFVPERGLSRANWERRRRDFFARTSTLEVALSDQHLEFPDADHARVSVRQEFRADAFRDSTRKTLVWLREGKDWHIVSERTDAVLAQEQVVAPPPVPLAAPVAALQPGKQMSAQNQADNEYARASLMLEQGRTEEANAALQAALKLEPRHVEARTLLARLWLEQKQQAEAERLLIEGISLQPEQSGYSMLLARMKVARNDLSGGVEVLKAGLPQAQHRADYRAFYATLLQRAGNHAEAVTNFQAALHHQPGNAPWWLGLGISLQAAGQASEAKSAFQQALALGTLSPELQRYAQQQSGSR
jgi:Tfp pilus assembly protein PilF/ketosteroid isomerase-like protein